MKRITSILTGASVVLLLPAAAAVTASSQTSPKVTPIDKKPAAEKKIEGVKKSVATNDAPQYPELRCRGGGLRFVVVDGRATSSGEQTMYMTVDFKHAAQSAGLVGRSLQPVRCAFVDRALRTDEPEQIIQEIVSFGQLKEKLHGSTVDTSPTAAERYPDAKNVPQYLSDAKHYWSFFVHQNAPLPSGRFESSYSRYWKPGADPVRPVDSTRTNRDVLTPQPDNKSGVVKDRVGSSPTKLNAKLVNDGNDFQLICRAGPDLRVSDTYSVTGTAIVTSAAWLWRIAFSRSTQPAHSGRNLQPGQCSPAEFSLRDGDPAQIQIPSPLDSPWTDYGGLYPWEKSLKIGTLPSERATKLMEYLKDPQNYWSFFVKDDGQGDFMAGVSRYWKDGQGDFPAGFSQYWKPEFYKGPQVRPFDPRKKANDIPSVTPKKP
jgi:hypothetical protein